MVFLCILWFSLFNRCKSVTLWIVTPRDAKGAKKVTQRRRESKERKERKEKVFSVFSVCFCVFCVFLQSVQICVNQWMITQRRGGNRDAKKEAQRSAKAQRETSRLPRWAAGHPSKPRPLPFYPNPSLPQSLPLSVFSVFFLLQSA